MHRISLLCALVILSACGNDQPDASQTQREVQSQDESATSGPVTLSAEGTRFSPPIEEARIPEGAWYCDMGTVHYAASERGDGECPVCGMRLSQRESSAAPPSGSGGHDHGHEH